MLNPPAPFYSQALLVSLSPSFLGVLHPHVGCRVDSAVTLLRFVKTLPEAVFCLNLFSHIVLAGSDQQTGGGLGGGRHPGLDGAVTDLLARFPVGEVALSLIPLSSSALAFSLLAGGEAFVADWLVAAPLARIRRAIGEFGAFGGGEQQQAADDAGSDGEEQPLSVRADGFGRGREALCGVLGAALRRWGTEIESNLEQKSSDAVIHRLTCVLLMSPDAFLSLAFDADVRDVEPPDREQGRRREELAGALGAVVTETLERLAALLSPVVSRRGDRSNENHRTSKLACASQVSQLASAFLRARCVQGYYTAVGGGSVHHRSAASVSSGRESPEVSLARACGGLLQGMLDPRLGQGSSNGGRGSSVHGALLAVLNLVNALLVLVGGDSDLLRQEKKGMALALQESHAALSEVLATTTVAIKRLTGWLDHAPDTLAAFLQACVLWNALESPRNGFVGGSARTRLHVPFQVLVDVLSVEARPCGTVGGEGSISRSSQTKGPPSTLPREVRRSLLKVLALRCVENAARARFFSREEVLALQLTLQGVACDGSAVLASAAHGALQSLWEAYAGFIRSADLVGQSWNPFMVECSLENALRSLSGDREGGADLLRWASDPEELCVDASVLVSTIGRLLRVSAGKACPRLSHSQELGGGGSSLEVLSATAALSIYRCAALVAQNLCTVLGDGMDRREDRKQRDRRMGDDSSRCSSNCSEHGLDEGTKSGDAELRWSDALMQVVPVLTCMEPLPQESPVVGAGVRRELADKLSSLHPALLRLREARPCLTQVSMPLSSGAYHDCAIGCDTLNSYGGVLFVKYDNWRSLCSAPERVSFEGLAGEIERLAEHQSGRPGAGTWTGGTQGREEQDRTSNAMLVDAI